jgi:hypothetical protein
MGITSHEKARFGVLFHIIRFAHLASPQSPLHRRGALPSLSPFGRSLPNGEKPDSLCSLRQTQVCIHFAPKTIVTSNLSNSRRRFKFAGFQRGLAPLVGSGAKPRRGLGQSPKRTLRMLHPIFIKNPIKPIS